MVTLLVTATIYDHDAQLAYSVHNPQAPNPFGPVHQTTATAEAWGYLLHTLPGAYPVDSFKVAVIDRRPGTRANSRSRGIALT